METGRGGKEDKKTPIIYGKSWPYTSIYAYIHVKYAYIPMCICAYKHVCITIYVYVLYIFLHNEDSILKSKKKINK